MWVTHTKDVGGCCCTVPFTQHLSHLWGVHSLRTASLLTAWSVTHGVCRWYVSARKKPVECLHTLYDLQGGLPIWVHVTKALITASVHHSVPHNSVILFLHRFWQQNWGCLTLRWMNTRVRTTDSPVSWQTSRRSISVRKNSVGERKPHSVDLSDVHNS